MAEMKARILILAASSQGNGRCVAGKMISDKRWVRAVMKSDNDGIPNSCLALVNGGTAMVGDIVEMALSDQMPECNHQTENRIMAADSPWKKVGRVSYSDLDEYANNASDELWENGEQTIFGKNNCVSDPGTAGSLRFFRLQDVEVKWVDDGYNQVRPRPYAIFQINKANYKIRVTDRRDSSPWSSADCHIPDCFVCVSLTQKFSCDGRYYKLVACIIEPERLT